MSPALLVLTSDDARFYSLVGPHLASRAVHKALGGVPWDDPGKVWMVAPAPDAGPALGFVGISSTGWVESLYTVPDQRDTDLAVQLVDAAVREAGARDLRAKVRSRRARIFESAGFQVVSVAGDFTTLKREKTA